MYIYIHLCTYVYTYIHFYEYAYIYVLDRGRAERPHVFAKMMERAPLHRRRWCPFPHRSHFSNVQSAPCILHPALHTLHPRPAPYT